jgi:hypothetical protein
MINFYHDLLINFKFNFTLQPYLDPLTKDCCMLNANVFMLLQNYLLGRLGKEEL